MPSNQQPIGSVDITGTAETALVGSDASLNAIEVSAASVDGKVPALVGGAVPVTASTLPLPTGAATAALQTAANATLLSIEDAVHSASPEWATAFDAAIEGRAAKQVVIIGRRSQGWSSTSVLGDVADYLDTSQPRVNTPTFGTTYYLYSSSAADDGNPASTGALTVRVVSLDNAGAQQVNTYTMDGTTKVSIGATHAFFQWMEVASVGSGTAAAGNISITSDGTVAAPTAANTFEYIIANTTRSTSGRYKVPAGCTCYLVSWHAHARGGTMDVRLRADVFSDDRAPSPGVFHFQAIAELLSGGDHSEPMHYLVFPAGTTIKVSAFPGGTPAGNKCDASFDGLLVSN